MGWSSKCLLHLGPVRKVQAKSLTLSTEMYGFSPVYPVIPEQHLRVPVFKNKSHSECKICWSNSNVSPAKNEEIFETTTLHPQPLRLINILHSFICIHIYHHTSSCVYLYYTISRHHRWRRIFASPIFFQALAPSSHMWTTQHVWFKSRDCKSKSEK